MRTASVNRKTKETDIKFWLSLDGGEIDISTGIGFFDHMLQALAKHAGFGMKLKVTGDLEVDGHHTVEDTGIVIGEAFAKAIGDKKGIARYGTAFIPMDEALACVVLDISGRPFLIYNADMPQEIIGEYDCCLTCEFMRAFAYNGLITLHISAEYGDNSHHITEAIYKALAHALRVAVKVEGDEILSTKGAL